MTDEKSVENLGKNLEENFVNHLITILIALFGGLIWQKVGIETLFVISAILGLCNSAYAATIKTRKNKLS